MKITVFTGNQPRHISLINSLAGVADKVYAIQEVITIFPGQIKDFYDNSDVMNEYFKHVRASEKEVFGEVSFLSGNIEHLAVKDGDLSSISKEILAPALDSDYYVVFGASYIKGWLIDFLIEHNALNIHIGVSPYYRGNSCNFWALYDRHPELVGATIHMLSKGLDSGDILYHALPKAQEIKPFVLGMEAVKVAHDSLRARIADGSIKEFVPVKQDKSKEMRYTKNSDFDDAIAKEYLDNMLSPTEVKELMEKRNLEMLVRPYIG